MDTSSVVARTSMASDTLGRRVVPRRFRTVAEKRRIVQEWIDSGCSGAEVARRHGVNANLVFTWSQLYEQGLLASQPGHRTFDRSNAMASRDPWDVGRFRAFLALISALVLPAGLGAATSPTTPEVTRWSTAGVSSNQFESHAAFDPRTGDLYFVRSAPNFTGWHLLMSHCTDAGWSHPIPPAFAAPGLEADPWFTSDGRTLYFISNRSTDGVQRPDLDVWRVSRDRHGRWGLPLRLPAPINSATNEWFPRLGADHWLYFGSARPGGLGKTDIWRARADHKGHWVVENLGPNINTSGDEFEALPTPDGTRMFLMADGALFQSQRTAAGWSPREKLAKEINVNGSEVGATVSASGRSLLFSRDTGSPDYGEFFVWHVQGQENWPPACPPLTR